VQAKPGIVEALNNLLTIELTAVNQYFLQAEMCENWGFSRLYKRFHATSLDEMQDAQRIIKHILYLEGVPNLQRLNRIQVGENVVEQLQAALQSEQAAVEFLTGAIAHCVEVGDYTTRAMFEEMIASEERHIDWLETQFETIRLVGLENYLAQQMGSE
jgi:bacterioferritin